MKTDAKGDRVFFGWVDTSNKPAIEKARDGMQRHLEKYGTSPNLLMVNAGTARDLPEVLGARVEQAENILPGDFLFAYDPRLAADRSDG
jgi:hypothetical protein